jgi:Arc/MetJ family transcription regulator
LQAMARTNIDINERLVRKVMKLYGFETKREAVDFALRRLAGSPDPRSILALEGMGFELTMEELRYRDPVAGVEASVERPA